MDHLKDRGTVYRFCLNPINNFHVPQELYEDSITDLEARWEQTRQMWSGACKEVVCRKTAQHKEWITPATLQKIKRRRKKKKKKKKEEDSPQ